jgi:multisubunit Na+/H+ antiporter MnhG subunit
MKFIARIALCLFVAFVLGGVGFMAVATYGPLLFPEPLSRWNAGVNIVIYALPLTTLALSIGGFALAWRLTKGLADKPTTLGL